MQQPTPRLARSTPIGLLLGLLFATPVFVLIFADLRASRPTAPSGDPIARSSGGGVGNSVEDDFARECDLFAAVLDDSFDLDEVTAPDRQAGPANPVESTGQAVGPGAGLRH